MSDGRIAQVPGLLEQDLLRHVIPHLASRSELRRTGLFRPVRGEGVRIVDADGTQYLDGVSGGLFAVTCGFGRQEIVGAMAEQATTLCYSNPYSSVSAVTAELSERLAVLTPGRLSTAFFCNSGSEAVEAAIKLTQQYCLARGEPRRQNVVSRIGAYHGATFGAGSVTGWSANNIALKLANPRAPFNVAHAAQPCVADDGGVEAIQQAVEALGPETVACVIGEPVTGPGVIVPPPDYWGRVRELCDRYGILLIADEVVCGFGRLGSAFGSTHFGFEPDVMVLAKGLTSGYAPMAAAVTREEVADAIDLFPLVSTFGGHPVSAAAANAALEIVEREDLVSNAAARGDQLLGLLGTLPGRYDNVTEVRGLGMLAAFDLAMDRPGDQPADAVVEAARQCGLLVRGMGGTTVQLAPALIYSEAEVEELFARLCQALDAGLGSR